MEPATELSLGLPGGEMAKAGGKRAFEDAIDLKLKLLPIGADTAETGISAPVPEKPSAPKAQMVGWPPVRSYRKNIMAVKSGKKELPAADKSAAAAPAPSVCSNAGASAFVKVSLDGAPYLRKVDLKACRSYADLLAALEKLFINSLNTGKAGDMIDFMSSESKILDLVNGKDFVPTYEDKDGDLMLVGDVPWEMFVESCKRLRIMKRSDANGLALKSQSGKP